MLACKKKIFNKFFVFSVVFLIFSFCCHAEEIVATTAKHANLKKSCKETKRVQAQQKKIIHSLEKIERSLTR